jgi:subtilisin family serine protease
VARLAPPRRLGDRAALALAIRTAPGGVFDLSHVYAPNADVYARVAAGLPGRGSCVAGGRVGLVDTAVADHPALARTSIRRKDFSGGAASFAHGTAVASIIAGSTPAGGRLVENAELYAAAVFSGSGTDLVADAIDLVSAIDWMIDNHVPVVNLSIAGPPNALIADAVARSDASGIILVAAAGNGGPRGGPRYPAAYPSVVAVTATDRRGRIYRRASAGSYVDIAAPGVDVWAADLTAPEGAEWTGTSFAAPFVTVELVAARTSGQIRDSASAMAWLARSARDLGTPGRDRTFGLGLLQSRACGQL